MEPCSTQCAIEGTDQRDKNDQIVEYDMRQLRVPSKHMVDEVLNPTATP